MNAEKQGLALLEEPAFDLYRRLVDFAASLTKAVVLLVVRPEIDLSNSGRQVLSTLEPYWVERRQSPSWPGTQLFDADAEVFYFRLLPESAKVLKAATDRLYGWCHQVE